MGPPTVLLISDDARVFHASASGSAAGGPCPAFTLMTGYLCQSFYLEIFDIAIIGDLQSEFAAFPGVVKDPGGVCQSRHLSARTFDLDAIRLLAYKPRASRPPNTARHVGFGGLADIAALRSGGVRMARCGSACSSKTRKTLAGYMLEYAPWGK